LDKAAATQDPILRLKYVVAFTISGLHRNIIALGNNGPLNPILGETFHAEKRDGTTLYCEQITHHPPVSAYLLNHPKGDYKLYGTGEVTAKMVGLNTINGQKIGDTTIEFKDGGKIIIGNPEMRIDGLIMGERVVNYMRNFTIIDQKNKVGADITFNYEDVGTLGKITSSFKGLFGGSKTEKPLYDTFSVCLFNFTKKGTNEIAKAEIATGTGSWLSHLELEGEMYWRVDETIDEQWMEPEEKKLKSDSSYREDSKYIKVKNYDQAQKEKERLENLQRHDAKIRKSKNKK